MSFQKCEVVGAFRNPEDYHEKTVPRGDPTYPMSPSQIKTFMECGDRWVHGYEPPESSAKAYGSLLDCRILTPELFETRYKIKPATYINEKREQKPWSGNSNVCNAWLEDHKEFEIVSAGDFNKVETAAQRLRSDPIIASLLDDSDKQVHVAGFWHDDATGLDIPVQCLLDLVPRADTEWAKCAADLKSSRSASVGSFTKFAYQMGYHLQAAFDLDILSAATGEDRNTWLFILQESYPPFQTGRRMLGERFLDIGRRQYRYALASYAHCLKSGVWPDYDDHAEAIQGFSLMQPASWMENDDMRFNVEHQEPIAEEDEMSETPT